MSVFFQNPAWFGLLVLAGLPLAVHLLSRAKPPEYRFSNIEFLRRVIQRTARFRKPKDVLLLVLRTLAILALVAAFISPFLISRDAALPGERLTVILIIDRSASMAAREGAGSRLESACAQASRYLGEAKPTAANLIWIDAEPDAVFPEPGSNVDFLAQVLNTAEAKPEPGALTAAFDLAFRQLAAAKGRREIVVLSDFQASAWRDFQLSAPKDLKMQLIRVASGAPANLAVTRLLAQPAQPVAGQETTVLASVRNFSGEPVRTQLTLDVDGSRQSQPVEIPAWSETETAFVLRPASAGPLPVTASIEPDGFHSDDSRFSIVRVRDSIHLAASGDAVISKVANSLPWLEATDQPAAGDVRAITSWSGAEAISADRDAGVTVLIHDAAAIPQAALRGLLGDSITPAATMESSPTGWKILPDESHPAMHLFRSGEFGNPFEGSFRQRIHLPDALANQPGIRIIARYADGVAAVFELSGPKAPLLFFNLALDPAQSDWATQSGFLPAFAEILLRTRSNAASDPSQALPGSHLTKLSTDPAQTAAIRLIGPDSKPLETLESAHRDGTVLVSRGTATPGIYRWEISGQPIDLTAVNFPETESDLRPLHTLPNFGSSATAADSLERQAALARGIPLWPWLVLATLLCLLIESLLNSRSPRTQPA